MNSVSLASNAGKKSGATSVKYGSTLVSCGRNRKALLK
jgi:hypothetical protein